MAAAEIVIMSAFLYGLIFGQAEKTTVVLMPDPDGMVGQVEVINEGGRQLLDQAHQVTTVTSATTAPSEVRLLRPEQIRSLFGDVLSVEPTPPQKFSLYFVSGGTELTAESVQSLDGIVAAILEDKSRDVGVHGHSDRVGSTSMNNALSLRRAEAVRDLLIARGVDAEILETASHGEGNPVVPTADEVAEPRNRRVEVVVR